VKACIRGDDLHFPRTRLIAVENTHNRCSGSPLPAAYLSALAELAAEHHLGVHMDGARIFNAAAALDVPVAVLAEPVDSLSFCLSKGLSAPVGSLVCGRQAFIRSARRNRKLLGGGMRQAGVIAAAGIVALKEMTDRLVEDHENARRLAEGIGNMRGARVAMERIKTNIVYVELDPEGPAAADTVARLVAEGVRVGATGPRQFRAVTHYGITGGDIENALKAFAAILD